MRPLNSSYDTGYCHLTNSKFSCQNDLCQIRVKFSNLKNLRILQFRCTTFFAALISCTCPAFFSSISVVVAQCSKKQVVWVNTCRYIARMTNTQFTRINFVIQKISNSMGSNKAPLNMDSASSDIIKPTLPDPTSVNWTFNKVGPKSSNIFFSKFHNLNYNTGVGTNNLVFSLLKGETK